MVEHFTEFIKTVWQEVLNLFNIGEIKKVLEPDGYSSMLSFSGIVDKHQSYLATDEQQTYVVYFSNKVPSTGDLKNLKREKSYLAKWYNTRNGTYINSKLLKQVTEFGQYPINLTVMTGYYR